ncbi:MAG: bacteriohemerythrin [Planctomycetota bacterium]|nr:MAG: bacteriohemerythrin [Planctomycetota bacterium]
MALVGWNPGLSVNVAEIDSQHRKLIDLINKLHDAMKQRKGNEVVAPVLGELINYTKTHFQTEEQYFQRLNYPKAASHKLQHAEFVRKVADFESQYKAGKMTLTLELMNFLANWLKSHIQGSDKAYTEWFNEHGVA